MATCLKKDIHEDFRILKTLGSGAFGEVKLACHLPTNTKVAVKVLKKTKNGQDNINSEVNIIQSLEHRNIVQFFHVINTLTATYLIIEYVSGKNLRMFFWEIEYFKEKEARKIFQQVVSGVHYLHQRHIAHCDIKLENILIDSAGKVKLCDFGMATKLSKGQRLKKIRGTLLYLAPEILARKPYEGLAVDMWSLGVVLYVMVTGQFPYVATTFDRMHKVITSTKYPIPNHLSKPCQIIISQLLTVHTKHRITICQLLEKKWLGNIREHVEPAAQIIIPRVVESMCNIGYTYEEIVSSLKHSQPNEVRATFNILKHKFSCEDCPQQDEKPWLNVNTLGALLPPLPLKWGASEPGFSAITESWKKYFPEKSVEARGKRCQSYTMLTNHSYLEMMPSSNQRVPKKRVLMANDINNAAINSVPNLPGDPSSCELVLNRTPEWFLYMCFSTKKPPMGTKMPNKQPKVVPITSESRSLSGWKLMRTGISYALRALCCFSPSTRFET